MYGQWCNQLLETKHKPSMYSYFWVLGADEFFLGASLGGCVFEDNLVGSWPLPVKRGRYSLVGGDPVTLSGWSFRTKPEKYQTIGNCAETYPIVHLLRGLDERNKDVHGLSLKKKALKAAQYQDTLSGDFWTRVVGPCENCQFLIELHGGILVNFCRFAGSAGAPA
ncbi:hypothetical protein N7533_004416 [Penicillium manginii]|uniref:uncharacterized protein n=1 Tax=Penicillium manginii TaxID=203109 RepID=UPI002546A565|nr:uncharacterized protein N7533_004416 [Penicillium manginii]KAJ5754873.1 hypothetical protein N7533_004416 [Penicillium manginii]